MQRPTSAVVFGILNIAFAAIGAVGLLATAMVLSSVQADSSNPVLGIMRDSPAYMTWMKIALPVGMLGILVLLAGGIGLLCFKTWGRTLSIGYAIYGIVNAILAVGMNFFFLCLPMLHQAQQQTGPEQASAYGSAIGGTIGSSFGLIYPVLLLIFMTRPKLVAAFRGTTEQSKVS